MRSFWFETLLTSAGWADRVRMTVRAGLVETLELGVEPAPGDERCAIGVPGLGDLHSHAFQRGMAGLAETQGATGDSFWTWRDVMYRFLERLTPDHMEAIAALAYAQMLEAGFTRVGEFHYLHHDPDGRLYADPAEMAARLASAASVTGIGLTLLPVFYAHAGFGGVAPTSGQRRFVHDLDGFAVLLDGARRAVKGLPDAIVGLAPHSLRAVTEAELRGLIALAGGDPIHIHIAEQVREVEDCLAWSGQRPVEWLLNHAPVDRQWCLVHATHLSAAEVDGLLKSGATAGLCPITEANLGDGLFPAPAFLAAGGAFGVGSDSNVLISAVEELRTLEYGQRLTRRERNVLAGEVGRSTGASLFRGALAGGAQALGQGAGALDAGTPADFVTLDAQHPSMIGRRGDKLLDSWIFASAADVVDGVWRRGALVVKAGRHLRRASILARYRKTLNQLIAA